MARLEEARAERGLSQCALAALAEVGESTVGRIERGTTTPRPHVARRLAAALEVEVNDIEELRAAVAGALLREPALRAPFTAGVPVAGHRAPSGQTPGRFDLGDPALAPPDRQPGGGTPEHAVVADGLASLAEHDDPGLRSAHAVAQL